MKTRISQNAKEEKTMANKHKKKRTDLKPRWLPISGMGVHGDVKYNRRKAKQELRRLVSEA